VELHFLEKNDCQFVGNLVLLAFSVAVVLRVVAHVTTSTQVKTFQSIIKIVALLNYDTSINNVVMQICNNTNKYNRMFTLQSKDC
jgi:hypothetical protein